MTSAKPLGVNSESIRSTLTFFMPEAARTIAPLTAMIVAVSGPPRGSGSVSHRTRPSPLRRYVAIIARTRRTYSASHGSSQHTTFAPPGIVIAKPSLTPSDITVKRGL
jgi:hypothetical protein